MQEAGGSPPPESHNPAVPRESIGSAEALTRGPGDNRPLLEQPFTQMNVIKHVNYSDVKPSSWVKVRRRAQAANQSSEKRISTVARG